MSNEEYDVLEHAKFIADEHEEYSIPNKWFSQIPLHIWGDPTLVHADLCVYAALDFLAGSRGWYYESQDNLFDKVRQVAGLPIYLELSNSSIRRAINKLRGKDYIRTKQMGLRMNGILAYYVMFRKPENPPKRISNSS